MGAEMNGAKLASDITDVLICEPDMMPISKDKLRAVAAKLEVLTTWPRCPRCNACVQLTVNFDCLEDFKVACINDCCCSYGRMPLDALTAYAEEHLFLDPQAVGKKDE